MSTERIGKFTATREALLSPEIRQFWAIIKPLEMRWTYQHPMPVCEVTAISELFDENPECVEPPFYAMTLEAKPAGQLIISATRKP